MGQPRTRPFERYEDAALHVLRDLASQLGIARVEGPQVLRGLRTGAEWHVEGRAWRSDAGGFLVIECRRVTSGQKQEQVTGLAYRLADAGASGAILVTPVSPQSGALKVATAENVTTVILDASATAHDYVVKLIYAVFVKFSERRSVTDSWTITRTDEHGDQIDHR